MRGRAHKADWSAGGLICRAWQRPLSLMLLCMAIHHPRLQ